MKWFRVESINDVTVDVIFNLNQREVISVGKDKVIILLFKSCVMNVKTVFSSQVSTVLFQAKFSTE